MCNIALETKTKQQEALKAYLETNASETLADKINNGVKMEKDGKTLLNKKTLDGFMNFALEEAKKQAEKGARGAMVEDEVVYGWLIHYFEEQDIIGTLYNEDGTEYKPIVKKTSLSGCKGTCGSLRKICSIIRKNPLAPRSKIRYNIHKQSPVQQNKREEHPPHEQDHLYRPQHPLPDARRNHPL